ncbi:hypothetical protein ACVWZ9_001954 [Pseudomonas chlororaphis]
MRIHFLLATPVAISLLIGCVSQPAVKYEQSDKGPNYPGDFEGLTKFSLSKSVLYAAIDTETKSVHLVSTPAEAGANGNASQVSFMIRPSDGLGTKTHLKVTKRDNTDLLESVGTDIEDNRTKVIESVGGVAVSLIGAIAVASPVSLGGHCKPEPAELPLAIDTEAFLDSTKSRAADQIPRNGSIVRDCVQQVDFRIKFGSLPSDAIARDTFVSHIQDTPQETLFYSACRTATVTFITAPLAGQQFTTTVADPNFVQTVKLPAKGKIDMHSACGVNTTSEQSGVSTSAEVMNTLISQAKSVREAWKTKTDSSEKK